MHIAVLLDFNQEFLLNAYFCIGNKRENHEEFNREHKVSISV